MSKNSINSHINNSHKFSKQKEKFIDKFLISLTGFNLKEITKIAKEKKELDFLNEYRWALSLWAEHTMDTKQKIIVTLDGRDTAGKWSNIKRVTEYFNNSRYNIKAFPGVPSAEVRFQENWFKRYENFFPKEWEVTFFDRSWYNRAFVEAAMGFCTKEEYDWFMNNVSDFEKQNIIDEGFDFLKIYLSVTKETQKLRLKNREQERKRWKSSPIDAQAQEKWNYYTLAKYNALKQTDTNHSPWIVIDSNEKWLSSIEIIKAIINTNSEISKIISKDLNIDLKINKKIRRTAEEELKKMANLWYKNMKKSFNFKEDEKTGLILPE